MDETRGLWRGKRIDNGEWVTGLLSYRSEWWVDGVDNDESAVIYVERNYESYWVDPSTLGECTGLHDKNGKLIFEGDIISFMESTGKYYVAKWDNENVCFYFDRDIYVKACVSSQHGIIVGNIHDNPELLKGENNVP